MDIGHMYLKSWYICDLVTCGGVMTSCGWRRKFASLYATRQVWYCLLCGRRYRVCRGQLVELKLECGSTVWTRAEVPDKSMEDLRAMAHEQKLGSNVPTSADDFFKFLKSHLPVTGTVARHVRRDELYDAQSATWQGRRPLGGLGARGLGQAIHFQLDAPLGLDDVDARARGLVSCGVRPWALARPPCSCPTGSPAQEPGTAVVWGQE